MKDAETVANFTLEVLTNFGVPPCYSISRPYRRSLALDRRLEIANGLPKWTARMRSGLKN